MSSDISIDLDFLIHVALTSASFKGLFSGILVYFFWIKSLSMLSLSSISMTVSYFCFTGLDIIRSIISFSSHIGAVGAV